MEEMEKAKLHYVNEHLTCKNYLKDDNTGFVYWKLKEKDRRATVIPTQWNYLVVVLEGQIRLNCERWTNREIGKGEMFLIPKSSHVEGECLADCEILTYAFDSPATICEKLTFNHLAECSDSIDYNLNTLKVCYPVTLFLELLIYYLSKQTHCFHLHEIKGNEFFLCLRFFYSKEELASMFYPILSRSQDFRSFVLENSSKVKSVKELIALSHMSRSVFYDKFSSEFGMPAKQWLTERFLSKVLYRASEPGITVKKLMFDLDFSSLSQFQAYCKRNFGCTPTDLIDRGTKGDIHFSWLEPAKKGLSDTSSDMALVQCKEF